MKLESRFCTLCGQATEKRVLYRANFSDADFNHLIFSARRNPDCRHFRLVRCLGCGMVFSDPAGDPKEVAKLYESGLIRYEAQESEIYSSYVPVLDMALRKLTKRGTFVEIGGGSGFMLKFGRHNGFAEQIEIEPSCDAENKFRQGNSSSRFIRAIFDRCVLKPASASLICFFQVLDHVANPRAFLEAVYEALEPGGVAVCVTHNTSALSARVLGERSPIFDIAHTYLFNSANIRALFEIAGFVGVDAFKISNRYSFCHWLSLAPVSLRLRARLATIIHKIGLERLPINLYAGNLAVIGQKNN